MAFWMRAGLVIGAIYYLSPLRLGEAPGPAPARPVHASAAFPSAGLLPPGLGEVAGPVLDALPDAVRARIVETAAAEAGRVLGTGPRTGAAETGRPASRDTLTVHDRQPAWRGSPERETR